MHYGWSICFKLEDICVRNIGCFVDYMVLFSFLKLTLLTKGCGIWGMRVVIVNIFAEVWRKLILLCSLSRYLINRRIKIAFFKHRSWVSFFLRHTVESIGFLDFFVVGHSSKPPFVYKKCSNGFLTFFHQETFAKINSERSKLRKTKVTKVIWRYQKQLRQEKRDQIQTF